GLYIAIQKWKKDELLAPRKKEGGAFAPPLNSLVIPKQTGPNLRGFGHEAMSRMCRLSALSPGGRTSEVPRLRAAFHVDVGVGLGTTAHSDEGTPAGVVRAGRAVVPAAVPVRYQRGLAGAVLPTGPWLLCAGGATARAVRRRHRVRRDHLRWRPQGQAGLGRCGQGDRVRARQAQRLRQGDADPGP